MTMSNWTIRQRLFALAGVSATATLLVGGFFRSLQFTSTATLTLMNAESFLQRSGLRKADLSLIFIGGKYCSGKFGYFFRCSASIRSLSTLIPVI